MHKFTLVKSCLLVIVLATSTASAADLSPPRAPFILFHHSWTGPYVGLNAGGGWSNSSFSGPFSTSSFDTSGAVIGGTLGYNWEVNQVVLGIEGDIGWSNIRGSCVCDSSSCEMKNGWLATLRSRLGVAFDDWMPFFTGGFAFGDIRNSVTGIGSGDTTKAGWTLGGGLEVALPGSRWTGKIEYLYVDLGRGGSVLGTDASFHANVVRVGLNYRF